MPNRTNIRMDREYTSDGVPARILCVDAGGRFPVAALIDGEIERFTKRGAWCGISTTDVDLKQVREALTQDRLKELLHYDPDTGVFTWKVSRGNARAGSVAGSVDGHHGYWLIGIDGGNHRAHRLAWFYVYGTQPDEQIDHINGVRSDNRINNLREATNSQNQRNTGARSHNTSGFKGVRWHKASGKYCAAIQHKGKRHHLGLFSGPDEAHAAYCKAADDMHRDFANHGRPPKKSERL